MSVERIATTLGTARHPAGHGTVAGPGPLMRLWFKAVDAMERRRARRLIGEMDDRILRDIGIVRSEVEQAIRHGREGTGQVLPWWKHGR